MPYRERLTFYRLQDEDGRGLYYSDSADISCIYKMQPLKSPYHCLPEDDILLSQWYENYFDEDIDRFAFCSLQQYFNWVHRESWREEIADAGLSLIKLVADGFYGESQGFYDRLSAEVVRVYNPNDKTLEEEIEKEIQEHESI